MTKLLYYLFGFERPRNKMNVLVVILIHLAGWCLFFLLPLLFYPVRFEDNRFWFREIISKLFPIGLFYFNYYFLLPRFFERKKFVVYFSLIFISIVIVIAQDIMVRYELFNPRNRFKNFMAGNSFKKSRTDNFFVFRPNSNPPGIIFSSDSAIKNFPPMPFEDRTVFNIPKGVLLISLNRIGSLCLFLILLGGMIRLGFSFIKNQNEKKLLENTSLNAEINSLKSQINPHFLFNTLNGIYSLAHTKSNQTEAAILKLSDLMRYVLYESGTEKIELEKDVEYLSNYIDLQRLRLSPKVTIHYKVRGSLEGYYIAPLLLISFIENAFKHGISYTKPSFIQIEIRVFEETLTLFVENPVVENNSFTNGGVGLKNVRRRLELLYPEKYSLNLANNDRLHIVNLKINLT